MVSFVVITIVAILFILGLLGTILPGLPGVGLIFVGITIFAVASGFAEISLTALLLFAAVTAAAMGANWVGSLLGTKVGGGAKWATLGTLLGSLVGLMTFGPLGLPIGAFCGALFGALYEGKSHQAATRAAFYSVIGLVGGTLVQFILGVALIVAFLVMVL